MHRRMVGPALIALSVTVLAGCGSSDSGDTAGDSAGKTTEVTVGVIPIVDVAPLYLGQKQGLFEKRGIRLKMVTAQGGAAIIPGVVSGQFQFGFSNTTSLMLAQSKGVPVKAVANGAASNGKVGADVTAVLVKKDSPVKTAKDLAGRTVAVNTLQNIGDTTVRETVRLAGGDPKKVKFVEIPFDQMPAALDEGRVDAAWMGEPSQTIAKNKGARVVASPFAETDPVLTVAAYFTSAKIAQQNPALVKKFTEAMNESLAYASAHPDDARQILTTYTKISGDVLDKLILPSWPPAMNRASLDKLAQLGVQDGVFGGKKPDVGALFS